MAVVDRPVSILYKATVYCQTLDGSSAKAVREKRQEGKLMKHAAMVHIHYTLSSLSWETERALRYYLKTYEPPSAEPKPDFCKPDSVEEGENREKNEGSTDPGEDAETGEGARLLPVGAAAAPPHAHSQARLIVFLDPRKTGIL